MTVKIDFLISPAYSVPPIRTSFLAKLTTTKTSESRAVRSPDSP